MLKHCWKCSTDKESAEFFKNSRAKDGLQTCCKICSRENAAAWSAKNREKCRGYVNKCAASKRGKRNAAARARYRSNPDKYREVAREYAKKNPEKMAAAAAKLRRRPDRALHTRISAQIRYAIGSGKGGRSAFDLLGYTLSDLQRHIERQFQRGMSWENMSEWHIDHIVPVSSFGITGPNDPAIKDVWALTNLRPLWAVENIRKHANRTHLI